MTSKSGLHKKVAFIFDGTPSGSTPNASEAPVSDKTPQTPSVRPPTTTYGPQPIAAPAKPATARPTAKKTQPAARQKSKQARKKQKTDPKQAKMLVLVAVLAVVFVGILFFVLNSPTPAPKKAGAANAAAAAVTPSPEPEVPAPAATNWTRPEPWPDETRDPMTPGPQGRAADGSAYDRLVKGIVYSQTNPSAIVGDRIVSVGDTINGITIVAIEKDAVEFEKDGKRWTQPVQR